MNTPPSPVSDKDWANFMSRKTIDPWEKWFAWYPIAVHHEKVWLTTVYRRKINTYVDMDNWTWYEYGTIFDVLTE